jgi:hypothetical protein
MTAHVRTSGEAQFRTIELVRKDDAHWVAVVPAVAVAAPGLDYYLDAGGQPVFATAGWPHTIPVRIADESARKQRDLERAASRRSRIHTMGEWVEFGTRRGLVDHYYRFDADFSYKLLAYPLEEIRVGYTRVLGTTEQADQSMCPTSTTPCTAAAGFRVGGWFELGLAAIEGIRFDGRMMVIATAVGFAIGGRAEAHLGLLDSTHVAVGVESLADAGTDGYFRLGWGTVPKVPMSATVEITNVPASTRPTGVRLYYDVAHEIGYGIRLGLRVGYAARTQSVAGFTGGAAASVDF